jgi:hypothetical protein
MSDSTSQIELRKHYADIVSGHSTCESKKYGLIHAKHLGLRDTQNIDIHRDHHYKEAIKKGLPTGEEKTDLLIKEELWDKEKDKKVKELQDFIERTNETKSKLILKSEVARISEQIEEAEKEVEKILNEKSQLVGLTAEIFADKKVNDYYIYLTLYKDKDFSKPFFTEEEFDELTDNDLSDLILDYNKLSRRFSDRNMKRIALSSFFLNNFYLCKDNPFIYFGKPVIDLTYHQSDLFSYGRYFKHILSEMKHQPPPDVMADPDKLLDQYHIEQNKAKLDDGKENSGAASTMVGATKEDMEALGMTKESAGDGEGLVIDLNEEMRKKGGNLSMEDMIKLHGV